MMHNKIDAKSSEIEEFELTSTTKIKTIAPLDVIRDGKLAVDGLKFIRFDRCIVDELSMIVAKLTITAKLIHDGSEYLISIPAEVVKMQGDDLSEVELEIDSHKDITTPGCMFVIKPGELASNDYISEELYVSRGESALGLAQLHDDWMTLRGWIRFEMRLKLS
jgi:hypothetical protein